MWTTPSLVPYRDPRRTGSRRTECLKRRDSEPTVVVGEDQIATSQFALSLHSQSRRPVRSLHVQVVQVTSNMTLAHNRVAEGASFLKTVQVVQRHTDAEGLKWVTRTPVGRMSLRSFPLEGDTVCGTTCLVASVASLIAEINDSPSLTVKTR